MTKNKFSLPWRHSLRFKLVATAVAVEFVMLALLLSNSFRLLGEAVESQTQARLEALFPLLDASLGGRVFQRDHTEVEAIINRLTTTSFTDFTYVVVRGSEGELIAKAGKVDPENLPSQDRNVVEALRDLIYDAEAPLTLAGHPVGTVRFGLSLTSMLATQDRVVRQGMLIAALEVLLSLFLLASGGWLITRHLHTLAGGARRVASGDYAAKIDIPGKDEIAELARDFNAMSTAVEANISEIRKSEARFRAIFDSVNEAIFIHDAQSGAILDVNQRMCELYGYTHAEALRCGANDLSQGIPPYAADEAMVRVRAAMAGTPQRFDWLARHKEGRTFWVEVSLHLARIGDEDHLLAVVRDISDRKEHDRVMEYLAHHDPLTRLPNRVLLSDRLEQAIAHTRRSEKLLAVAYLDLDGFKPINDSHGHNIGDQLLVQVAQRLTDNLREVDTACRLGGDEFVLLLSDIETVTESQETFERLRYILSQPYVINGLILSVTSSIGLTLYPLDDTDADTLLRHADQAMYAAKQGGRNRYHLFDHELDRQSKVRHETRSRVREALENHEFVLYFQPKVNMQDAWVVGAEALIRWNHPEKGVLAPAAFLHEIEESELAIPIGEWVLEEALRHVAAWRSVGLDLVVSVNVFALHLQSDTFLPHLAGLLARHPEVPANSLEIEVVETVALEDIKQVSAVIDECHRLGVRFALDDFGTGYSSLSYFKRLNIDVLKIDQSFVRDMLHDPEDRAIVEGIIALTRSFHREVIAEGVENAEIGQALLELGCEYAQGYGIARPMPAEALAGWVAAYHEAPSWTA